MAENVEKRTDRARSLQTLAMVNTAIWALAIVGLALVVQRAPAAKGLFVILAGGTGVSVSLLSLIGRSR